MGYVLALWGEFVKFTGGRAGLVHLLLFAAALVCCGVIFKLYSSPTLTQSKTDI